MTWTRSLEDDAIVLRAGAAWICVRPRVAPPIGVRALVDATLATLDAPTAIAYEPARELVGADGELVALGGARCVAAGAMVECTVAIVGDVPALHVTALGPAEARTRALALVDELGLGLGAARRRWFRYDPPPGWFGVRRAGATHWLGPAHPRMPAHAIVFDARPVLDDARDRFERDLWCAAPVGLDARAPGAVTPARTSSGLEGHAQLVRGTRAGRALVQLAVAYTDERYAYLAHVEVADEPALVAAAHALCASFRPLPRAQVDAPALWVD